MIKLGDFAAQKSAFDDAKKLAGLTSEVDAIAATMNSLSVATRFELERKEVIVPDMSHIHRVADEARARNEREKVQLELLRRSTIASEQALADALRREAEAKEDARVAREEAREAKSLMRTTIWLALGSLFATALVFLIPQWFS